jgi:hypothetical protein
MRKAPKHKVLSFDLMAPLEALYRSMFLVEDVRK